MHSLRHWTSFFVGLLIFAAGLIPLIKWPAALSVFLSKSVPVVVLMYLVAFGGIYIIVDSFFEFTFHSGLGIATLLVGLLVFGLGLVAVLGQMKVIALSLPFMAAFGIVYSIVFILEGLFLMIGCFVMD